MCCESIQLQYRVSFQSSRVYEYIFYLQLLDSVNNTNYNYTLFTLERNQLMLLKRVIVWRTVGCERGKTSYYIKVTVMCSALTLNWYADIYICTVSCSRGSMCKQTFNNALYSLDLRVYRRILIWPLKIYHYSRI